MRYTVYGSHGTFEIDERGVPHGEVPRAYGLIVRWDLAEWQRYWNKPFIESFDVLDLGGWTQNGAYEPAEADWREEIKRSTTQTVVQKISNTLACAEQAAEGGLILEAIEYLDDIERLVSTLRRRYLRLLRDEGVK